MPEATTTEATRPVAPTPTPLEYTCPRCKNPKWTRPHTRKEGCKYEGTVYDGNPKGPGRPVAAAVHSEQVESLDLPLCNGPVSQSMIAQASTAKGVKSRVNQGGSPSAPLGTLKGLSASARDLHPAARHSSSKPSLPFEDAPDDPGDFELLKSIEGEKASGLRPILIKDMVRTTGVTKEAWRQAAIAEIEGLRSMQVFREATPSEVAEATKNSALLPMKLVAGEKPPEYEGGPRKKKVRLVVCGNFDRRNLATSLSTTQADAESLRMVLRLAAWNKWDIAKADVKQAFLRAPLPEEGSVVVTTPKALEDVNVLQRSCWVLQRALYGLREAPKAWQNTRDQTLLKLKCKVKSEVYVVQRSGIDSDLWLIKKDPCRASPRTDTKPVGFLIVYVDDFLVLGARVILDAMLATLSTTWECGSLQTVRSGSGESLQFLGLNICLEKSGSIWIDQKQFALDLLDKWKMKDANPTKTPGMTDDWKGAPPAESTPPKEVEQHLLSGTQQMVGSLLWLSGRTRPDLAYPVSRLASFLGKDLHRAFGGCKKALRYLRGTLDCGLRYETMSGELGPPRLEAFGDASFGAEDLQAQQGVVVFWGSSPVIWRSCRQTLSSSSTAEAELQAIHLTSLILENSLSVACELMGESLQSKACVPTLRSDNTAAICLATEPPQHWRTRHLALRAKVVQERLKSGGLILTHVSSSEQRADSLTKPFTGPMMEKSRSDLGVHHKDRRQPHVHVCRISVAPSHLSNPPPILVPCKRAAMAWEDAAYGDYPKRNYPKFHYLSKNYGPAGWIRRWKDKIICQELTAEMQKAIAYLAEAIGSMKADRSRRCRCTFAEKLECSDEYKSSIIDDKGMHGWENP